MNIDQVQAAYVGGYRFYNEASEYDKYDTAYVKVATSNDSKFVSEIYDRVNGHFQDYVTNIDTLLQMNNCSDGDVDEIYLQLYLRYTSGFQQASVEYLKDLKLYEKVIIEKPFKRVAVGEKKLKEIYARFLTIAKLMVSSFVYIEML